MKFRNQIRYVTSITALLFFCLFSGLVDAQLYKWVDENGVTHFSDRPTREASESDEKEANSAVEENPVADDESSRQTPDQNSNARQTETSLDEITKVIEEITRDQEEMAAQTRTKVELYVTSWCGYCKKAKAFFRSRGIRFVEYDVERNPAAARRMSRMTSSSGVPFAVINGYAIQGYSEAAYKKALKK
jgi:glutaredoxin